MTGKNHFVIVAPMYNASAYVGQMIASICAQSYNNWKIILIDDVSDENHVAVQGDIIDKWNDLIGLDSSNNLRIETLWNLNKKWEVANVLCGISLCNDEDIILRIDGDDWLTDIDALACLNVMYDKTDADCLWTAHRWNYSDRNISAALPVGANPYTYPWVSSHLKTFRKKVINGIPYENFTNMHGDLVRRAGDQALYLPILHQSKIRAYVPRVMYHYTIDEMNGAVYQTDDAKFQKAEADFIRARGYVSTGTPWENYVSKFGVRT